MNRIVALITIFLCSLSPVLFAQQIAILEGGIHDEFRNPIENVQVLVESEDTRVFSDANGHFSLKLPSGKKYRVRFQHLAYKDTVITVELGAKESKKIALTLLVKGEMLKTMDVRASYNDGYVRIDPSLNYKIPTPSGGVESLIKMLPGASSANELSSQYNVRGGNYDENLVYVNDIEIYRPFLVRSAQQEGLSFVNLDLTRSVKFSAGGFEARYGDKMSSVLDVEYRRPTRYAGSASVSLLGATAHAEGNVKDIFTFLVGVRYKNNAYILKSMESRGDYKPVFFDAQMLLTWKPVQELEISLLGNFSKNSYLYAPTKRETDYGLLESLRTFEVFMEGQEIDKYENYLGALTFNYTINRSNSLKLILSSYFARESETYDILNEYWLKEKIASMSTKEGEEEYSILGVGTYRDHARNYFSSVVSAADLRGEHRLRNNTIMWGTKVQSEIIHDKTKEWSLVDSADYVMPQYHNTPGEPLPFGTDERNFTLGEYNYLFSQHDLSTIRLSGFVQDSWRIGGDSGRFVLTGGLRYSFWSYNKEFSISPRLNLMYKPKWKDDWVFYFKTGWYYQPPFYKEMKDHYGELNKDLKAQRSFQLVLASEYNFKAWRRPFRLSAEVYYKYLDRLVSYAVDNVKIIYSGKNDAVGYAAGLDMKLSGEFIPGMESWISLSLMKTAEDILDDYYLDEDGNKVEPGYIPRPTDQRFAINIFFQDHIPGFTPMRVHLNFIFGSGLPYGAPNAERYTSTYVTKDGKKRTLRTSWYRRVDIGFSYLLLEPSRDRMKHKSAFIRSIKSFTIFFEVLNLLGTNNVSSHTWVTDTDNIQFPVPNYLTPRLFNLKFAIDF